MQFCTVCNNMLNYVVNVESGGLVMRCKSCTHETPVPAEAALEIPAAGEGAGMPNKLQQLQSTHMRYDVTLPRVTNVTCTNKSCTKPSGASNCVAYIKYDCDRLLYLFSCNHCGHTWHQVRQGQVHSSTKGAPALATAWLLRWTTRPYWQATTPARTSQSHGSPSMRGSAC